MSNTAIFLLLKSYPQSNITLEELSEIFPEKTPYKGEGRIVVDNVEKAKNILKEYIGQYEFESLPEYLFLEGSFDNDNFKNLNNNLTYLSKFEIENIKKFFILLINSGVSIINFQFLERQYYGA